MSPRKLSSRSLIKNCSKKIAISQIRLIWRLFRDSFETVLQTRLTMHVIRHLWTSPSCIGTWHSASRAARGRGELAEAGNSAITYTVHTSAHAKHSGLKNRRKKEAREGSAQHRSRAERSWGCWAVGRPCCMMQWLAATFSGHPWLPALHVDA